MKSKGYIKHNGSVYFIDNIQAVDTELFKGEAYHATPDTHQWVSFIMLSYEEVLYDTYQEAYNTPDVIENRVEDIKEGMIGVIRPEELDHIQSLLDQETEDIEGATPLHDAISLASNNSLL